MGKQVETRRAKDETTRNQRANKDHAMIHKEKAIRQRGETKTTVRKPEETMRTHRVIETQRTERDTRRSKDYIKC